MRIAIVLCVFTLTTSPLRALDAVKCKFSEQDNLTEQQYTALRLHDVDSQYKYFDKNCDGLLDRIETAAYDEWQELLRDEANDDYRRQVAAGVKIKSPTKSATKPVEVKVGSAVIRPILRDSFQDISVFGSPKNVKLASGAQLNFSRDFIDVNSSWTAKGIAALPVTWLNPENPKPDSAFDPYLAGITFAPTINFNRVYNSNTKLAKKDVNVLTYGGAAEIVIGHVFDETTLHFFRARGAYISDFNGRANAWSVIGEYQPITNFADPDLINIGSPNPLGFVPVTYQIDTIARFEHMHRINADIVTDPIFLYGNSVSRGGGVVMLSLTPEQGPDSSVPDILQKITFNASYSYLQNFYVSKAYPLFSTALSFALDPNGNIAVKLSYDRGKVDETGQKIGLLKFGLAAKF